MITISCTSQADQERTFRWAPDQPDECMISLSRSANHSRTYFSSPLCVKIIIFHVNLKFFVVIILVHVQGCRDRFILINHMTQISQWNVRSKQEVTRMKLQYTGVLGKKITFFISLHKNMYTSICTYGIHQKGSACMKYHFQMNINYFHISSQTTSCYMF